MEETVVRPRAASAIAGVFALLALSIAATGIFGVLSYAVQSRRREIGIRSALGATASQVTAMVLGQSTRLVASGLVVGVLLALAGGRLLSGLLFGIRPWDPVSLLVATGLLALAGGLAAWLPARRAVKVPPTLALESE